MVTDPEDTPLTTPLLFTVAIEVLLLFHAPPEAPFVLSAIVEPAHTADEPLITPAFAAAVTVMLFVALAVLHPVTV